ncbi:MAG: diguanylate cyclase, partial [Lysobacterales bacterium]
MSQSTQPVARFQGLRSIKAKVTIFALMATLVPSVVLGLLHYNNSLGLLQDKISQGLQMTAEDVARESSQWLENRRQDLDVFSQSYTVVDNVNKALEGNSVSRDEITAYLHSVLRRSPDLEGLAIFALSGDLIVSTDSNGWTLPEVWLSASALDDPEIQLLGGDIGTLLMGAHMTDFDGKRAGFLAGRVRLRQLDATLNKVASSTGESIRVIDQTQRVISQDDNRPQGSDSILGESLIERLRSGDTVNFWREDGTEVVARMSSMPGSPWSVMAEREAVDAFAEINNFRRLTVIISGSLMIIMAMIAYLFSTRTLAPLRRLTEGASEVASGDLNVRIKVRGKDEISYLTRVFNNMVERLEHGRQQVEKTSQTLRQQNRSLKVLSNTDSLTGLYNRQHLTNRLERLLSASEEGRTPFAILMIDLDRFKALNDDYGHVAGDEAIRRIAEHIRDTLRKSDYAARFGGEEFVVLLPKVDAPHAFELAERLRLAVASTPVHFDHHQLRVTASIGVASYPEHGRNGDLLIRRADAALYEAKDQGRNTTVVASGPGLKVIPTEVDST